MLLQVLPEVVAAVGATTPVLFDGGVRRGSDVVKALALGARGVLLGRAHAYGMDIVFSPFPCCTLTHMFTHQNS